MHTYPSIKSIKALFNSKETLMEVQVLSLNASPSGRVQVATITAGHGLLAAGGFTGELAVQSTCTLRPMRM